MENQLNLIRCISVAAFTTCVAITGLSSAQQPFPAQQKTEEKAPTAPTSQPHPDQQMRLLLDDELKARLNPEVEKLRSEMKQMLDQTDKTREKADNQVSLVADLMDDFLGVLGVVFAVLAAAVSILVWLGFQEIRTVKGLRRNVEKDANATRETLEKAAGASTQVMEYRKGLEKAWGDIDVAFNELPKLGDAGIVGASAYEVSLEKHVMWEDKDLVVIVCDQLRISSSSVHFRKLGEYWGKVLNFPRAMARHKRAIELAHDDPTAHRSYAKTLAYWAAFDRANKVDVEQRLSEALREADKTTNLEEKPSADTIHLHAWIYDELGEVDKAIRWYREAQTQSRKDSAATGETENLDFSYNLACSLAKANQFQEACNELKQVVEKDGVWWNRAQDDPDFDKLRQTAEWRKAFPDGKSE